MNKYKDKKICFGIIVGTRGFFNPDLAKQGRKELLSLLDELDYDYFIPAENETPNGAIETLKDARLCADLFNKNNQKIDGIIVVLPNFGDELGVVNAITLSGLHVPVLVQACNDDIHKVDIYNRRDAFCGKISVCNNLYQYNIPFTDTSLHTCDIKSDTFKKDLDYFGRVCRIVKGISGMRIGAIGTRPAAFQTVRFSEKILQANGITVVPVDLSEIIGRAEKLDRRSKDVLNKLEIIRNYGNIPGDIHEENVLKQAKLSVVIDTWMAENELDASAIQCWESVQHNYGCATCLSMSLMGEDRMPSACEVDITGAVSMYVLLLASGNPPGFLDWNNNYKDEMNKCVNTHCSNYPRSFMGNTIEISNLDILGETIGREKCFGAIKGHVAPGPMTFFRISTDDVKGTIKGYLGQGEFTDDPFDMDGGIAVCKVNDLREILAYICQNGFEHHIAMARSYCAGIIKEAVTTYLHWDLKDFTVT
ncbi:MAG: fucose isomerase [Spirochaetales bacterium]|nr:fucose isomerase [Spirochaetales bacterium]